MVEKGTIIFNVHQNRVVCSRPEDFFFQAYGVVGFGDLNLFS